MKPIQQFYLTLAVMALNGNSAIASTAYGDINNFDVFNDTGQDCHGFEIEIDGIHKADITYTFDWNHYAYPDPSISSNTTPKITEDNTDPNNPKVFVRYESAKKPDGTWQSFTAPATSPIAVTDGHMCTDPSQLYSGCEHFGVGYYGTPTAIKYHWLVDDGSGNLKQGQAVSVGTPTFVYNPPVPALAQPANVVAAIPAPDVPIPPNKEFGEPSWVKVIKTTSHNNNDLPLKDLASVDNNGDGLDDWTNGEPDEVETEWKLLQTNNGANNNLAELPAVNPDELPNNNETVTRRYEFYKYAAGPGSIDGETGEAMCDAVAGDNSHGDPSMNHVGVTDANGDTQYFDCSAVAVVGDYIGAQMAAFDPEAGLGLIDNLQDGDVGQSYERRIVVGGNSPYMIVINSGALPPGLAFETDSNDPSKFTGILKGTPTQGGNYLFGITVTDAQSTLVSTPSDYTLKIAGGVAANQAPVANDSAVTTNEDTAAGIMLSASDADNDALTYSVVAGPVHGTLSGNTPNLTYIPAGNYNGTDSFTFKASDGKADSNTATVNIAINAVNDVPTAVNDTAKTYPNTAATIPVMSNDSDVDGDVLTLASVTAPAHGTATKNGNNVVYTPNRRYSGSDTFTYTVSDGKGGSSTATVTVMVAANKPPVANADTATTTKNMPVTINVLANDTDPDGDTLTVSSVGSAKYGTVVKNTNNTVTFTPKSNYAGTGSFSYTISDGHGGGSSAKVTVTIK